MSRLPLTTLVALSLTTGCVTKKKYNELQSSYLELGEAHHALQTDHQRMKADMDALRAQVALLEGRSPALAGYYADLLDDLEPLMRSGDVTVTLADDRMTVGFNDAAFFAHGDDDLSRDARQKVRQVAERLRDLDGVSLQVEGHTDASPVLPGAPWQDNFALGAARAQAVLDVLRDQGVDEDRLSIASYGETEPVATLGAAQRANRRVSIVIDPALHQINGAAEFVAAARQRDAVQAYASFDHSSLRSIGARNPSGVAAYRSAVAASDRVEPQVRPDGPELLHDFAIPVKNGATVRVRTTADDKLHFEYGANAMIIHITTPDEVEDELRALYDEVAGWEFNKGVTGAEIDDEIRDLLVEAIDHDTLIVVNGVAVPGNEVDREVGEFWDEVLDRPGQMVLTRQEIDDELEDLQQAAEEQTAATETGNDW